VLQPAVHRPRPAGRTFPYVCGSVVGNADDSVFGFYQNAKPLTQLIRPALGGWLVIPAHGGTLEVDTQFGKGPNILNRLNTGIVKENLNTGRPNRARLLPDAGVLSLSAISRPTACWCGLGRLSGGAGRQSSRKKRFRALEHVLKKARAEAFT